MPESGLRRRRVQPGHETSRTETMMSPQSVDPHFRDLSQDEIIAVLKRNQVGRLAYSFHDLVCILPIQYVYNDNCLFGRTSPGDKLITLTHNQCMVFEVDEIEAP